MNLTTLDQVARSGIKVAIPKLLAMKFIAGAPEHLTKTPINILADICFHLPC
jgi:hypothetical protein